MKRQHLLFLSVMFIAVINCFGQDADLQKKYTVVNRVISAGPDGSIHLNEANGVGIAWLNGAEFTNGTIEFDAKGKDVLQASFIGVAFHGLNDTTYETVYFRPFNFRATDTLRKAHAVQYMTSPKYEWPKLRAEFPGKYEKPIIPAPDPNAWFHVRITVEPKIIRVYVNGNTNPALVVEPLVAPAGKKIGYWAGGTDGDWKNLKIVAAKK